MSGGRIVLALLALAAAAAIWMLVPADGTGPVLVEEATVDSCAEDVACSAGIAEPEADSAASTMGDVEAAPPAGLPGETPGAEPAAGPAAGVEPASAADAVRLQLGRDASGLRIRKGDSVDANP